jgi:DNA repair exonuclease SbcCD nuclease subunit
MGHIHKKDIKKEKDVTLVYPGSAAAMGFDELGEHGAIVGNIDEENGKIATEFIPFDTEEFVKEELDIGKIYSFEELIEKINNIKIKDNKYYEIVLKGKRRIEIDINKIISLVDNERILKVKDISELQYDIEEISKEETLKGIFARKILFEMNQEGITEEKKKELEKAFEIGIEVLK